MAYQNVGTPRFYVNDLLWGDALGFTILDRWTSNPTKWTSFDLPSYGNHKVISIKRPDYDRPNYYAILGHNMNTLDCGVRVNYVNENGGQNYGTESSPIANGTAGSSFEEETYIFPDYDGFSIAEMTSATTDGTYHTVEVFLGTNNQGSGGNVFISQFIIGKYYDMPQSPNLSLTKSIDYGETKEITTYNGSSVSNSMQTGPPMHGSKGAWEITDSTLNHTFARSGRRKWDLKFSFLDASDVWGSNQSILSELGNTTYPLITGAGFPVDGDYAGYDVGDLAVNSSDYAYGYNYNLLTDENFFSSVWHKTLGGTLPFIFQPDGGVNGNNNADQFSMAKFVDSSLKVTQSAFNVYDVAVSIEEVW